jgi:hypothetical protein
MIMKRGYWLLLVFYFVANFSASAQNGGVSIGKEENPAHTKAILELFSEDKGLLIPRMDNEQRNSMFPTEDLSAKGMLVFDTDNDNFFFWNGTAWSFVGNDLQTLSGDTYPVGAKIGQIFYNTSNSLVSVFTGANWERLNFELINDLTTGGSTSVLSAEQGKILKTLVDANTAKGGITAEQAVIITNTSGTNTGDQDISGIAINTSDVSSLETEQTTQNTAIALNTAKGGITAEQAVIIAATSGTNTGDQDISGIAINTSDVSSLETEQTTQNTAIALNTDKGGITAEQAVIIAATSGTNTGDQDLSGLVHSNITSLDLVSGTNTGDQDLSGKVDKVTGSSLIADASITRLANTSGTNTGDQDLSGLVHSNITSLDLVSGTNTGDQDLSGKVDKVTGSNLITDASITRLANTSGINTGDQNVLGIGTNASDISTLQGEQTTQNTAIALNTAKEGITAEQALIIAATSGTNTGDQNISGIGINVTSIATNSSDISTLQGEQTSQNSAISQNKTDIVSSKVAVTEEKDRALAAEGLNSLAISNEVARATQAEIDAIAAAAAYAITKADAAEANAIAASGINVDAKILIETERATRAESTITGLILTIADVRANAAIEVAALDATAKADAAKLVAIEAAGYSADAKILVETNRATQAEIDAIATAAADATAKADAAEANAILAAETDATTKANAAEANAIATAGINADAKVLVETNRALGVEGLIQVDVDANKIALNSKENTANKSTDTELGDSNDLFPTQKAVKTYVDNLSIGLNWQNPVEFINTIGEASWPVSPVHTDGYIISPGGNTVDWDAFLPGDLVQYQTNKWVKIKSLAVGDYFGVAFKSPTTPSGGLAGKKNYMVKITGGTAGDFTYAFTLPVKNDALFVQNANAYYHNVTYSYSESLAQWIQLSASVNFTFDSGLKTEGNIISLGALSSDWNQTGAFDIITAGGLTLDGNLALGANDFTMIGSLGETDARLTKGWFTDLQVTNAIAGNITGNAATATTATTSGTVTTNANLSGHITSIGNSAVLGSFTSTNLASALSDETGTGSTVFNISPIFTGAPILPTGTVAVTQMSGDNTTAIATTAYSDAATVANTTNIDLNTTNITNLTAMSNDQAAMQAIQNQSIATNTVSVAAIKEEQITQNAAIALNTASVSSTASYGEIHSATSANVTTSFTTVSGFSTGESNDITLATTGITIKTDGVYMISYSTSFSATNNFTVYSSVFKGGTELTNIGFERKIGIGGDVGSAAASGMVTLTIGDIISVRIKGSNTNTVTFKKINLSVYKID